MNLAYSYSANFNDYTFTLICESTYFLLQISVKIATSFLNDLKQMLLFGTKKSIKMKIFLAVTPEKTIPEIADSFNPALNNSLSLLCAFINYSLWKEVPNRINLFLVMTENLF